MKTVTLFPSILAKHHLSNYSDNLLDVVKSESFSPSHNNNGGYSHDNTNILDLKEFKAVKKEILITAKDFIKNHLGHEVKKIKISGSWANKLQKNNLVPLHYHINSYVSGVLYLSKGTPIEFHTPVKPTPIFPMIKKHTKYTAPSYSVKPKKGLCVLFPANFMHSVASSQEDQERYSIGFNIVPLGKIGFPTANITIV
jgi:uncharacterized protein (TIGR02466 family)